MFADQTANHLKLMYEIEFFNLFSHDVGNGLTCSLQGKKYG